jgi:hypothetical protein
LKQTDIDLNITKHANKIILRGPQGPRDPKTPKVVKDIRF